MRFRFLKVSCLAIFTQCLVSSTSFAGAIDLATYSNVFYVSTSGSDMNIGDAANPFASVNRAIEAAGSSGDAIFVNAGEYDVTNTGSAGGQNTGLNNDGKDVDFIGESNETIFNIDGTATSTRDLHFYSGKGFSKVYNVTFMRDSNNRATNYSNAIFGFGDVKGEFYNSVFKSINSSTIGMTYDNNNTLDVKVFNSFFDVENDFSASYSGQNLDLVNSVSNKAFNINDGNSYTSILSNVTFDEDYNILSQPLLWQNVGEGLDRDGSQADLGVYGSTYSWSPMSVSEPSAFFLVALGMIVFTSRRARRGTHTSSNQTRKYQ